MGVKGKELLQPASWQAGVKIQRLDKMRKLVARTLILFRKTVEEQLRAMLHVCP